MSLVESKKRFRNLAALKVRSRGTARNSADSAGFKDLEIERRERHLKSERLREQRLAAEEKNA